MTTSQETVNNESYIGFSEIKNNINNISFEVIRTERKKKTVSFSGSIDIIKVDNHKNLTRRMSTPSSVIEKNLKKVEFAESLDETIFEDNQKCFLCSIFWNIYFVKMSFFNSLIYCIKVYGKKIKY